MGRYETKILRIIEQSHNHPTAEEIFRELKVEHPGAVLASVYNNLNSLYARDMVRKICIPGQPDRYDTLLRHDHLYCKACGRIVDITLQDITQSLSSELGCRIEGYDLRVYYTCPECRETPKIGG